MLFPTRTVFTLVTCVPTIAHTFMFSHEIDTEFPYLPIFLSMNFMTLANFRYIDITYFYNSVLYALGSSSVIKFSIFHIYGYVEIII